MTDDYRLCYYATTCIDNVGVFTRRLPSLMNLLEKVKLMTADEIGLALRGLAQEIVDHNGSGHEIALVGIRRRGVPLAERLARALWEIESVEVSVGYLDINLYRDDLSTVATQPIIQSTEIDFPMNEKVVVLVDDVLYTGRTVRAAMDALVDYGRPKAIQLCVLIDRGHRELPIQANFVGKTVTTKEIEMVEVRLNEVDQIEDVLLVEKAS